LGFHLAGFELAAALELDPLAAESHARNFYGNKETFPAHAKPRDITLTDPAPLLAEYGYSESAAEVIDVIVGGPPCQAFARVGRAKLREIAEHPTAYKLDPRGNLYLRFLEYIRQLQPLAILMENVPDVINYGGHNIPEETCEVLEALGYVARYTLLNAAFYGVPQMRERMFLIAYRKELNVPVRFPAPTRYINLPRGYESSRQVALRNVDLDLFNPESHFQEPPLPQNDLEPAVTAADALSDLPKVTLHLEGKLKRGARRFDELIKYRARPRAGSYPEQMRNWPGFEANSGVYDHVIRFLPRDYPIFRRMKPGDEYPQARAEAERMFEEELERLRKDGRTIVAGSVEYSELFDSIVPPYDPQKFPNKWRKLDADQPARTLMAHLGKDSYSHIHYDSQQARTISVREAARLQSFPDGFTFAGAMNAAFRQIGNAVPPLMANALARVIASALPRPYHENPARNKAAHCV
jgi:DNA (cytosine-5)-methyltransferase 1